MPGVWEEIHRPEEHGYVPVEVALWDGRESLVVVGVGRGCLGTERSVWGAGDYHPHLAVSERDAWQEAARAIHGRAGSDPCSVGRTMGQCEKQRSGYVVVGGKRCNNENRSSAASERTNSGNGVPRLT